MTNSTPTRLVVASLTITIIIILAVASRRESNSCGWNDRVANVYDCMAMKAEK